MSALFLKTVTDWCIAHELYFPWSPDRSMLTALLAFLRSGQRFVFIKVRSENSFQVFSLSIWSEIQDRFIPTSVLITRQLAFLIFHAVIIHNLCLLSFWEEDIFRSHDFVYSEISLGFGRSHVKYLLYLVSLRFFTFHLKNLYEESMSFILFQQTLSMPSLKVFFCLFLNNFFQVFWVENPTFC